MESRKGVTLKNPTMAQRRAIVAIAKSEGIKVYRSDEDFLNENYPWVWFSSCGDNLASREVGETGGDKYVSFKKFIEWMYQPEENAAQNYLWHCTKKRKMCGGGVVFKKGKVYAQIISESCFLLIDEEGESHQICDAWKKHFYQLR